jgi:hypothetical protein
LQRHLDDAGLFPSRRHRVGYGDEIVADTVGRQPTKNEESAVGGDDIARPKKAVVHHHVGDDALGLGGRRRLFLDSTVVLRQRTDGALKYCQDEYQ